MRINCIIYPVDFKEPTLTDDDNNDDDDDGGGGDSLAPQDINRLKKQLRNHLVVSLYGTLPC